MAIADSTVGMFSAQVFRESMEACGLSSRELSDRLGVGSNIQRHADRQESPIAGSVDPYRGPVQPSGR